MLKFDIHDVYFLVIVIINMICSDGEIPVFKYNQNDVKTSWRLRNNDKFEESTFDKLLTKRWNAAKEQGCFKYNLNVESRCGGGKYNFLLQLNHQRRTNRRKAEAFHDINTEFDHDKFNFTKINAREKLFEISKCGLDGITNGELDHNANLNVLGDINGVESCMNNKNIMCINSSPFSHGHSLFLPQLYACRTQHLESLDISKSIDLLGLSDDPNFCIAFSSVCAGASVNHLHLHCFTLPLMDNMQNYKLPVQCAIKKSKQISKYCSLVDDYLLPAFVFEISLTSDISSISQQSSSIISYLLNSNIAHNLCLVKAKSTDDDVDLVTRVIIWPRKPIIGAKCDDFIAASVCEMMGLILIPTEQMFGSVTEDEIVQYLIKYKLPDSEFQDILEGITNVLEL